MSLVGVGQVDIIEEKDSVKTEIISFDYMNPVSYVLQEIKFSGVENFDLEVLRMLSGLNVGDTILVPGEPVTKAVQKLWKQSLFQNIAV